MNHQLLSKIRGDTGQHSSTCQEYEKQPQTVEEDELKKQNNAKKPLVVSLETIIHDEVEHGVAIDCKESNRKCNYVMEIIISNKVARWNIADAKKEQINN